MHLDVTTPPRPQYTKKPAPELDSLYSECVASWRRALTAAHRSPATLRIYLESLVSFHRHLLEVGMPTDPQAISREHCEHYLTAVLARYKPATALVRYKVLTLWFRWLVDEGELRQSPMARVRPPTVPETPPPIVPAAGLRRLLDTVRGKSFQERRDLAILSLLLDTGIRRGECAGLQVADLDRESQTARVVGKGSRARLVPYGTRTATALDRYLRARRQHAASSSPMLWLGHVGEMTDEGIYEVVKRRAAEAGLPALFPHQLRHSFAHLWLAAGGQEGDLCQLAGWRSRRMLARYGASAAAERARAAYPALSPGDRL